MAAIPNRDNAEVIRNAQVILHRSNPNLKTDGHWGEYTNQAYANAPVSERMRVDAVLAAHGLSAKDLYATSRKLKRSRDLAYLAGRAQARAERGQVDLNAKESASFLGSDGWVAVKDMSDIIRRVSSATNVQSSVLEKFLQLEQGDPVIHKGKPSYNASSKNAGGYRGLFQFDSRGNAWKEAAKVMTLPDFESSWANPYYNTLAAALYLLQNTKVIRRLGYGGLITGNIAYLMHNQGAGGAFKIIRGQGGIVGKQSGAADRVIADARTEAISQRAIV